MNWQPDQEAFLTARWADGLSGSLLADELNAKWGPFFTRSSVIGKVHRLNLPPRKKSASRRFYRERGPIQRRNRYGAFPPAVGPFLCISFVALDKHHCRYPSDDKPTTYCGQRPLNGSSYCAAHHQVCHTSTARK